MSAMKLLYRLGLAYNRQVRLSESIWPMVAHQALRPSKDWDPGFCSPNAPSNHYTTLAIHSYNHPSHEMKSMSQCLQLVSKSRQLLLSSLDDTFDVSDLLKVPQEVDG